MLESEKWDDIDSSYTEEGGDVGSQQNASCLRYPPARHGLKNKVRCAACVVAGLRKERKCLLASCLKSKVPVSAAA